MGHFYCSNISKLVVRQVYARGSVTLRQMTEFALKHRIAIHAAEGHYDDECMLEQGIEELMLIHVEYGTLEPVFSNQRARDLWKAYVNQEFDWEDPRFHEFAQIPVRFAPGGRRKYLSGTIPHVSSIEH